MHTEASLNCLLIDVLCSVIQILSSKTGTNNSVVVTVNSTKKTGQRKLGLTSALHVTGEISELVEIGLTEGERAWT